MQKFIFEKTVLNPAVKESKKIVFYGAGMIGQNAVYNSLLCYGIQPDYICDSDKNKTGKSICGIEIINTEMLRKFEKDTLVVISSKFIDEIASILSDMGFTNVFAYGKADYWEQLFYNRCGVHKKIEKQDAHKINQVIDILFDKKSKKVYESILAGRNGYVFDNFAKIYSDNQYFPGDIIKLTNEEVFVDAGAYSGDTAILFAQKTNYQYKKILSFEPGEKNIELFKINTRNFKNIELFPYGIYSSNGTQKFKTNALTHDSLNINAQDGDTIIETRRLDDLLLNEKVTYIKMDIEGAELEALEGARKIIQEDMPKLAVAVYHKTEDIWDIPLKIHEINPAYKIYLRHHYPFSHNETVCYAIS